MRSSARWFVEPPLNGCRARLLKAAILYIGVKFLSGLRESRPHGVRAKDTATSEAEQPSEAPPEADEHLEASDLATAPRPLI
jgi:hypothetical protein